MEDRFTSYTNPLASSVFGLLEMNSRIGKAFTYRVRFSKIRISVVFITVSLLSSSVIGTKSICKKKKFHKELDKLAP